MTDPLAALNDLAQSIRSETDPKHRIRLCRHAVGLGRAVEKQVKTLQDHQIVAAQDCLRLAFRQSRGLANTNTSITKLAKARLDRLGLKSIPKHTETRFKAVTTDTACFAVSDRPLPENWTDPTAAVAAINAGNYFGFGLGADGRYPLRLRHIDMAEPFLEPAEYPKVIEALPQFALRVTTGHLYFGSAENITAGVAIAVPTGDYCGAVVSLRAGADVRLICTITALQSPTAPLTSFPELTEV